MKNPFVEKSYFINNLKLESFKDIKEVNFYCIQASKWVSMLINNPKIDLADDTTLTEKQKEAIINATIEFVLFFSNNSYDFNTTSSSMNFGSNSFSESRNYDSKEVYQTVINILKNENLIIDYTADYLDTFYATVLNTSNKDLTNYKQIINFLRLRMQELSNQIENLDIAYKQISPVLPKISDFFSQWQGIPRLANDNLEAIELLKTKVIGIEKQQKKNWDILKDNTIKIGQNISSIKTIMNQLQELNDKITSFNVEVEKLKNIKSDFDNTNTQVKDLDKKISDIDSKYFVEVQDLNLYLGTRISDLRGYLDSNFINNDILDYTKNEIEKKAQENTKQIKTNKTKIEKNQQDITILQDKVKDLGGETKDFAIYAPIFSGEYDFSQDSIDFYEGVKPGIPSLGTIYVIKEGEGAEEFPILPTLENLSCLIKLDNYSVTLNFEWNVTSCRVKKQNENGTLPTNIKCLIILYGFISWKAINK